MAALNPHPGRAVAALAFAQTGQKQLGEQHPLREAEHIAHSCRSCAAWLEIELGTGLRVRSRRCGTQLARALPLAAAVVRLNMRADLRPNGGMSKTYGYGVCCVSPAVVALPAYRGARRSDEACGQIIVVSFSGAFGAGSAVTRTKQEARARAETLLHEAQHGDFAALAKANSDAPSSAPRGGIMGTYAKSEWPDLHAALKQPLFQLAEGKLAAKPVEAPYGYVILRRCKVEKAHAALSVDSRAGAEECQVLT